MLNFSGLFKAERIDIKSGKIVLAFARILSRKEELSTESVDVITIVLQPIGKCFLSKSYANCA